MNGWVDLIWYLRTVYTKIKMENQGGSIDMINKNMEKNEDVIKINKEIDKIGELYDTWHLKYYLGRIHVRYDILIDNRDAEIQNLEERIAELEKYEIKDKEKINIKLIYDKSYNIVTGQSDSKKRNSMFDECGRKWFIPQLNDDSYIKIKFVGKILDEQERRGKDKQIVMGISVSSAIIGNTMFGKGDFKDIKNNFILNKRSLDLLLIGPPQSVWFYALPGTESIVLIESSKDINATLDMI